MCLDCLRVATIYPGVILTLSRMAIRKRIAGRLETYMSGWGRICQAGDIYVRLATSKEAKEASHPAGVVGGRGAPEQVVNLLKSAQA